MQTIGFIAAMPQEIRPLLRRIGKWERARFGLFPGYRFRRFDSNCLLIESGIGLRRAVDATRALLATTTPQLLVSFGVAGAIQADLQIGDVVIVRSVYLLDQGLPSQFQPLAVWSDTARQAASQSLQQRGASVVSGTAITTPGSQSVQLQPEELTHPVLEMETAGIAQVAAEQGIPLLALRAVSDRVGESLPFGIDEFMDGQLNPRPGKILKAILCHPRLLIQFLQLERNVERAADNAAIALVAALSQPQSGG